MATVRTPREAWVDAALAAVGEGGPDAVRVEALAAGLGVTKGGFYWHFADRQALLDAVLDRWEQTAVEDVIALVERRGGDARAKLRRLFALAPSADFAAELGLRDWARRDAAVAARLQAVDARRLAWLVTLFGELTADRTADDDAADDDGDGAEVSDDAEARSMLTYSLLIGGYFIATDPDGRSRRRRMRLALDLLLADPAS